MNINSFMPVKVVSDENCVIKNSKIFKAFGSRCLVVTGGSSAEKSGALADCLQALEKENITYSVFSCVEPNPSTKTCYNAGVCAREINADFIIGIGGGSPLDAAKAVAIFAVNPEFQHDSVYVRAVPSAHLPLVLIGTTAGTGSEVTGVSVLTNSDTGLKKSISGADCYAEVAFCDYRYTCSVPKAVTVSTALDAFAHAVEAYLASSANEFTFVYSEKAIEMLKDFILNVNTFDGTLNGKERKQLYIASLFAGLAINISGTDFPHTLGYYLTENHNIPHGIACAAFMPLLLERAKKYCPERLGAIENILDCNSGKLAEIIKQAANINIKLSEEEAHQISLRWKNGVKNFDRSPGGFTLGDCVDALKNL